MSAACIEEQAARWLLRREEPGWSAGDQAALESWLEESMAHKAAYWRLEEGWRRAGRLAALGSEPAVPTPWADRLHLYWQPLAMAASLLVMASGGLALAWFGMPFGERPAAIAEARFETPVGGRRSLALPDGSRIELNTATRLRTAIGDDGRDVWLDSGEAYFEVAHAQGRPFRVHVGSRTVTVLGTRFSVRRDGEKVRVAVVEGRVRIDPARGARDERSATIGGGDLAIVQGAATLVAVSDAERVEIGLAWRDGLLRFERVTLAEAAAEFNRYNRKQVIVADPQVAAIRIGGSFQASNVDAFVRLLRDAYGISVETEGDRVTISS